MNKGGSIDTTMLYDIPLHDHYGVLTHVCKSLFLMNTGVHIDYNVDKISYDDFINRELILFSHAGDHM